MVERQRAVPTEEGERFLLRLPKGMRDRIKLLAAQSKHSMNTQCVFMLQSFLDDLDREEYESSSEVWESTLLAGNQSKLVTNAYSSKDLKEIKGSVSQALVFLRSYVKKMELWSSALETQRLTMQLALWKQGEVSAEGVVERADLDRVVREGKEVAEDLREACRLLTLLHPLDPAHIRTWVINEEGMLPEQSSSLNETHRIDRELQKNFVEIAYALFDVHMLAKKEQTSMYEKGRSFGF